MTKFRAFASHEPMASSTSGSFTMEIESINIELIAQIALEQKKNFAKSLGFDECIVHQDSIFILSDFLRGDTKTDFPDWVKFSSVVEKNKVIHVREKYLKPLLEFSYE